MTTTPRPSPYGSCPVCGSPGISRERRPDGNDKCANGHLYKSSASITIAEPEPLPDEVENAIHELELAYPETGGHNVLGGEHYADKVRAHITALEAENKRLQKRLALSRVYFENTRRAYRTEQRMNDKIPSAQIEILVSMDMSQYDAIYVQPENKHE